MVIGSIIAISALGLTLIFGILNFINVAYGEYLTIGAYVAFAIVTVTDLSLALAIVLSVLIGGVLGYALHKMVFQFFKNRNSIILLIVSIGLAFILRNVVRIVWSTETKRYPKPIRATPELFGIRILPLDLIIVGVTLATLIAVTLLLVKTRIGIAMRAASSNFDLARVRGINTSRLILFVWLIVGMIGALSGILLGLHGRLSPTMGFYLLIPMFAAVILGGIGDPRGAVVGGYILGIVQEISVAVFATEYKPLTGLVIVVVILLTKPTGIVGDSTR
jgi:branched-subunit amino acid ABC-type transport system permease component